MNSNRFTIWLLCLTVGGLFAGVLGISGCATRRHQVQLSSQGKLLFNELHFSCQFEREDNVNSFYPIELASGSDPNATPEGSPDPAHWNRARLEIIYPIPESIQTRINRNQDGAIVRIEYWKEFQPQTVRTPSDWGWNILSDRVQKKESAKKEHRYVREAVIPRYQVDFLLEDMTHSGFFDNQKRPSGEAEIIVKIDEGTVTKNWDLEPRMREMIARTMMANKPKEKSVSK